MPTAGIVISALLFGFVAGAPIWTALAIRQSDRRWEERVRRLERYRKK